LRKALWIVAFVIAASLTPTVLCADNITYNVDVGVGGDILTGTITTDGTMGQLKSQDILGFSLFDSEQLLGVNGISSNAPAQPPPPSSITVLNATPFGTLQQFGPIPNENAINFVDSSGGVEIDLGTVKIYNNTNNIVGMTNGSELGTIVRELNLSSGTSGLVLVACSVLIIRGRRRIPTPIA